MARKPLPFSRLELLQGTPDLIIPQPLRWGPRHGYGLAQMIRAGSGDLLQVDTGSLYPALHRLEKQGAIAAGWEGSENRQRAGGYRPARLTPPCTASRSRAPSPPAGRSRRTASGCGSTG